MVFSVPLSLKAGESASLSLKLIFDELLHSDCCSNVDATGSRDVNGKIRGNGHDMRKIHTDTAATAEPDLDLRLRLSFTPTEICNVGVDSQISAVPSSYCIVINIRSSLHLFFSPSVLTPDIAASDHRQLTILYSGVVYVYDSVTVDQARTIMLLAKMAQKDVPVDISAYQNTYTRATSCPARYDHFLSLKALPMKAFKRSQDRVPFARKASLARFLKKRKEIRMTVERATTMTLKSDTETR
ncbi:hypothetical protein KP509_01G093100 [Ceratopteris richardii]|uniref:Tify domain-containing protein n=1 Tax=Ceratopteris richardii TaxID=49495 RepID=A0A8T2VJ92_CERRI|nr:hypothetical protein KP509_01G093100 [Ceratopteris richardii]